MEGFLENKAMIKNMRGSNRNTYDITNTNKNNKGNGDEGDLYLKERQLTDSSCQLQMSNRSEPNATKF